MGFPLVSLAKYSSVVVTAFCSGAGTCLFTHNKPLAHELQTETVEELGSNLKKKIHTKVSSCIEVEKKRLSSLIHRFSSPDTPTNYKACMDNIDLDNISEKLFAADKG